MKLGPFSKSGKHLNIIIETPKGSRNKYAFDYERNLLELRKVLPAGSMFPFDFGSIPGTKAADGDPLDVLVLLEEPVIPACLVKADLIGVIEAEQTEGGKTERNDRLVARAIFKDQPREVRSLKELSSQTLKELEQFFVSYNRLEGKRFKVLRYSGPKTARRLVDEAVRLFKKKG